MEEPRMADEDAAGKPPPEEEDISEVGRERKRKREEKRAQKSLKAQHAEANKDKKPWLWNKSNPSAGDKKFGNVCYIVNVYSKCT